jgi:hypothetical protein
MVIVPLTDFIDLTSQSMITILSWLLMCTIVLLLLHP